MKKILAILSVALLLAGIFTINSCSTAPLLVPYLLGEKEACLTINPYQGYQSFTFPLNQSDVKAALTSAEVADREQE